MKYNLLVACVMWKAVDVLGTKVLLKQWKSEAVMLICGHHGLVWRSDLATEVSVAVVPVKCGMVSTSHCICFRDKNSNIVMV